MKIAKILYIVWFYVSPPLYIVVSYNSYYTLDFKTCRCYNVAIKNKTKHQRRGGEKNRWCMENDFYTRNIFSTGNKFPYYKEICFYRE